MEFEKRKKIENELSKFIKDAEEYTSWQKIKCFRQFGRFDWFLLECEKLGLEKIDCLSSGLHYEAKGNGFNLEYIEGDIILSFEILTREQIEKTNKTEFLEFSKNSNNIRIIPCSLSNDKNILFGCWLQDGKDWEVLGYVVA